MLLSSASEREDPSKSLPDYFFVCGKMGRTNIQTYFLKSEMIFVTFRFFLPHDVGGVPFVTA